MTIIQACLQKLSILKCENLCAELIFSKIVLLEGKHTIRILDIEENHSNPVNYNFSEEIIHHIVYENLLWVALKFGELRVIDVQSNLSITIKNNTYTNYNIRRFVCINEKLYLITESGECLKAPCTSNELKDNFKAGIQELSVCYGKAPHKFVMTETVTHNFKKEIYMNVESGKIKFKCKKTGLTENINTNAEINYIHIWRESIVLASHKKMWLLDDKTYDLIFVFDNSDYYCLPVSADQSFFYYILWNEKEIQICRASLSHDDNENKLIANYPEQKASCEESLKEQLKLFIQEIILNKRPPTEVLPQLITFFNKITDFSFLINLTIQLCNHNIVYKAVLYQMQKQIFETNESKVIDLFCDTLIKVDLFEYICFRGINTYNNINIFELDFIQLCGMFISKSDMDLASICWLKYSEMKPIINAENILYIINMIPHNIKMGALIVWLRNFVPTLLEQNPYYIDIFVKWTTDRVFSLEQSSYWPKIGLKFIVSIIDVLETSIKTINIRPLSIDDLDVLRNHINYILELKDKYKINMLLSELTSLSSTEVALIMLRRCYTEDLEPFLHENLTSYASRYLFEVDDTLRSFIESEAASSGGNIDGQRLQILLSAFRSPTNKLNSLLQVLKVLDVPWNPTILSIATSSAALVYKDFTISESDRNIAQEIHKELIYAKIKVILKKYNFPLTCTDYVLVIHKLINAAEVNLEDLKIVTSTMTAYTNYINTLYIDRCLRDCNTKAALIYFNNLSNLNKKLIIKTVEYKYEQIIKSAAVDSLLERNYLDFLKGSTLLNNHEIKTMENLYHLKNSYKIKVNLNEINSENHHAHEMYNWNENIENVVSSGRGRSIMQLFTKGKSKYSKLISLLQRTSKNRDIKKILENLILLEPTKENFDSILSSYKNGQNSTYLLESYEILSEITQICSEDNLHYLLKHLSMLNAIINTNFVLKNLSIAWKFHYIFLPMTSINALNELIDFYVECPEKGLLQLDMTNTFNRSDFVPLRIIASVINLPLRFSDKTNLLKDVYKYITKLVNKIIMVQELDLVFVTELLLILHSIEIPEDPMETLDLLRGQTEALSPAVMNYLSSSVIRKTFGIENILPRNILSFPPQYVLRSKFNVNLDDIPLPEHNEETWDIKVLLFYILKQYPEMSFEKLMEMCQTLNICESDAFTLLLISQLINWELKYKLIENDLGHRSIYLENNGCDLTKKCNLIWQNIESKDYIKDVLNELWKSGEVLIHGCLVSINPYYYEIFLCIYQIIFSSAVGSRNMKEYYLLNFLKEYNRKSSPKQYEFELFSVKGMFPEIGYFRLPFHLFMRDDMWSNLKSEITLETYEYWLPIVSLLALDEDLQTAKDMICSNAVKQTMTSRKRNDSSDNHSKDTEPWRLITREEPLLRTAHRCVKHIANMEWAAACLFYVLQGCARGADQVAAAQLCYQFSQRWASVQPDNRAVRQMERLHSSLSTRHVLHKIEWACEDFLRLTSEPIQLIHALYMHPHFIQKTAKYDINRAANEIADKNGINISSVRIQILENILNKSQREHKPTLSLDINDLLTAKYILKATCPKMGAIYLSRIAFDDDIEQNKCKKLRALQCLMSLIEPENATKVTNRGRDTLWPALLELFFIVNLERIDMPWIIATFTQNKLLALNQLIQASSGNMESLKIAAELAHKFGDTKVIRHLIPLMFRASLFEDMIPLLLKVLYPPDKVIYSAWRAVILTPFQKADYPITDRQKEKCIKALNLLPICPVIKEEDLVEIWKNCVRCKCLGLGCLVLPYMTTQSRQTLIELQKVDKRNLIISLKNLHTETYLVSGAIYVLDNLISKTGNFRHTFTFNSVFNKIITKDANGASLSMWRNGNAI